MKKIKIKKIAISALFTAIIAASAWVSLPTPFGVNLAFTIFGVCISAFVLEIKYAVATTIVYIMLGAVGLPVFSQFSGGAGVLFGASGGFLWGFLLTAILCSIAKKVSKKTIKYLLMIFSVLICHFFGVLQYSIVTGNKMWVAFLSASLPFLFKDLLLVFLAKYIAQKIKIQVR